MADTRVVLPACPCPIRARLRRLAPSYTFTGCLLPQAYGKGDTARNEDEYRVQASPTTPAKLLMLTQGMGRLKGREQASQSRQNPKRLLEPTSVPDRECQPRIIICSQRRHTGLFGAPITPQVPGFVSRYHQPDSKGTTHVAYGNRPVHPRGIPIALFE